MLDGGVDPRYVTRRLIRMASEDIGLADPRALEVAINAAEVYERAWARPRASSRSPSA
jgi:putative ATPase